MKSILRLLKSSDDIKPSPDQLHTLDLEHLQPGDIIVAYGPIESVARATIKAYQNIRKFVGATKDGDENAVHCMMYIGQDPDHPDSPYNIVDASNQHNKVMIRPFEQAFFTHLQDSYYIFRHVDPEIVRAAIREAKIIANTQTTTYGNSLCAYAALPKSLQKSQAEADQDPRKICTSFIIGVYNVAGKSVYGEGHDVFKNLKAYPSPSHMMQRMIDNAKHTLGHGWTWEKFHLVVNQSHLREKYVNDNNSTDDAHLFSSYVAYTGRRLSNSSHGSQ